MKPFWQWPSIFWLLTGLPVGFIGMHVGYAIDPTSWWLPSAICLVGVVIGWLIWLVLFEISYLHDSKNRN